MLKGKHFIDGKWTETTETFSAETVSGQEIKFSKGNVDIVQQACRAAERDFPAYAGLSAQKRAKFLLAISNNILAKLPTLKQYTCDETGLPEARIENEAGRTAGQLCLFADYVEAGRHLDYRHDTALPDRSPLPRPDLKLVQCPVGPVAVFGASNFPLAFSVAGGDTASALAAGCTVVVKGHSAHPASCEIVTEAVQEAMEAHDIPSGAFQLIQGGDRKVGQALVQDPNITAVGFTGSLHGGRALFDLCMARETPIPFFGELGSINPVFAFPDILSEKAEDLANAWFASLTMGAGQFCTNPGVFVMPAGSDADRFVSCIRDLVENSVPQTMLTSGICGAFGNATTQIVGMKGVEAISKSHSVDERQCAPQVFVTTSEHWLNNKGLAQEMFGPAGVIVLTNGTAEYSQIAHELDGQLTCTLQVGMADAEQASPLLSVLERKAGRIIKNSFPTGVEVADAMVHGGPYPASTNFGATSVGTMAIRRFLRPVCYQGFDTEFEPAAVSEAQKLSA